MILQEYLYFVVLQYGVHMIRPITYILGAIGGITLVIGSLNLIRLYSFYLKQELKEILYDLTGDKSLI